MAVYPQKIKDAVNELSFAGKLETSNAVGTGANFACGSFVRFRVLIDAKTKRIARIGFESNGCGYMLASADAIASDYGDRFLTELHGIDRDALSAAVGERLGGFPSERTACLEACIDALESAFADFRAMQIEEFRGESALICSCFGVSEDRINEVITSSNAVSVDDVTEACNAGGGCGSCRILIQELLESA